MARVQFVFSSAKVDGFELSSDVGKIDHNHRFSVVVWFDALIKSLLI